MVNLDVLDGQQRITRRLVDLLKGASRLCAMVIRHFDSLPHDLRQKILETRAFGVWSEGTESEIKVV